MIIVFIVMIRRVYCVYGYDNCAVSMVMIIMLCLWLGQ